MNFFRKIVTPIGELYIECDLHQVVAVHFSENDLASCRCAVQPEAADDLLDEAERQMTAYFVGGLRNFDLPLLGTGSDFQQLVWNKIAEIPYGAVISYGKIALILGKSGGARAVGNACNRNPLPIIIPCHRVIGSNGKLTGYRGGIRAKKWLLELEERQMKNKNTLNLPSFVK